MYKDPGFGEYRLSDNKVWDGRQPVLVNVGTLKSEGLENEGASAPLGSRASDTGFWRLDKGLAQFTDGLSNNAYEDPYDINTNLPRALRHMEQAASEKAGMRGLYRHLAGMAQGRDKEVLSAIERDELKHDGLIRLVYTEITNGTITASNYAAVQKPTYLQGLQSAVMAEQESVQKCRGILFAMRTRRHINIITEVMTDELRHMGLLGCLLANSAYDRKA